MDSFSKEKLMQWAFEQGLKMNDFENYLNLGYEIDENVFRSENYALIDHDCDVYNRDFIQWFASRNGHLIVSEPHLYNINIPEHLNFAKYCKNRGINMYLSNIIYDDTTILRPGPLVIREDKHKLLKVFIDSVTGDFHLIARKNTLNNESLNFNITKDSPLYNIVENLFLATQGKMIKSSLKNNHDGQFKVSKKGHLYCLEISKNPREIPHRVKKDKLINAIYLVINRYEKPEEYRVLCKFIKDLSDVSIQMDQDTLVPLIKMLKKKRK